MGRVRVFLADHPIVTSVVYTVFAVLPLYAMSAQAPRIQRALDFGKTEWGLIVGSFFLVSAIGSRTLGGPVDRAGATRSLRIGVSLILSALVAIVVAGRHWLLLALFIGIAGVGNTFIQLASNLAIASHVGGGRHGLGFGVKQGAVPVGAMMAGLVAPLATDWRVPLAAGAVAALVALLVVPRFPQVDRRPVGDGPPIRSTALTLLAVAAIVAGGTGSALATFVADAAATRGFSDSRAATMLTFGSLTAVVVRMSSGWFADRHRRDGVPELVALMGLAVLGFLALAASGGSDLMFVLAVPLVFAGAWGWAGVMYYVVSRSSDLPAAISTGRVLAGAFLGSVIVPPLAGGVAESAGYQVAFVGAAVAMTISLAAVLASRRVVAVSRRTA